MKAITSSREGNAAALASASLGTALTERRRIF
jgi:hypothetical protein